MKYIKKKDILLSIKDNVLNGTTEFNDALLDELESGAIAEVDSYIGAKYDSDNIFNTATSKNSYLKMIIVDIVLYNLYSRITPSNIPEIRNVRYANALEWMTNVASGKLVPNLPIRSKEFSHRSNEILYGGFNKINNETI